MELPTTRKRTVIITLIGSALASIVACIGAAHVSAERIDSPFGTITSLTISGARR